MIVDIYIPWSLDGFKCDPIIYQYDDEELSCVALIVDGDDVKPNKPVFLHWIKMLGGHDEVLNKHYFEALSREREARAERVGDEVFEGAPV